MEYNKICGKDSIRYAGSERICSRLGDRTFSLDCSASLTPQTQQRLGIRIMQVDELARPTS